VSGQKRLDPLVAERLHVRVVTATEHGHEQMRTGDLAGVGVDEGHGVASPVHEHLLAEDVLEGA